MTRFASEKSRNRASMFYQYALLEAHLLFHSEMCDLPPSAAAASRSRRAVPPPPTLCRHAPPSLLRPSSSPHPVAQDGKSVLLLAAANGHHKCVAALVAAGADREANDVRCSHYFAIFPLSPLHPTSAALLMSCPPIRGAHAPCQCRQTNKIEHLRFREAGTQKLLSCSLPGCGVHFM